METMYYIGLDVHKKTISLLHEGRQWPYLRSRFDTRHTIDAGTVDENTSPAMDGGHGSDHLHGLDLPQAMPQP